MAEGPNLNNNADERPGALIAMSGGVDSSVAAWVMKERGYRCMGTTMRLYQNDDIGISRYHTCCSKDDIEDAASVAAFLDIPYTVTDYMADFRAMVMEKFIRTYEAGGVPNPCMDCNRYLKFDRLFTFAKENGLEYVVTGHYARIETDKASGKYLLKKAVDPAKDQSYFLYMLSQEQLAKIVFPLGDITKEETRKIAAHLKLENAKKHDSQDICFVPDGDYVSFMENYTGKKYPDGDIKDKEGNILGTHHGAVRYTPGQRRGLGVSASDRLYVIGKDMETNTVYAGDSDDLFSDTLHAADMNWISGAPPEGPIRCMAKTRYRQKEQQADVYPVADGEVKVIFERPQRAITPGQALVLYDGDTVLGGGTIIRDKEG